MRNKIIAIFLVFMLAMWAPALYAEKPAGKKSGGWLNNVFRFNKEIGLVKVIAPKTDESAEKLALDECIKIALANSITFKTWEKSLKLAQTRILEAKRNMLPTATIAFEETYGRVNARAYNGRKQYIEGQQPIFHGGELYYAVKQAEANLQVTRNDCDKTKNEIIFQVKKAYYSFAKSKENLVLQEALSKEVEAIAVMVAKAYEAGVISKLESLNVAMKDSQVKYQLVSAKGDVDVAGLILKQAMSVDPRQNIDVVPMPAFKKVNIEYDEALKAAYICRPEMKINSALMEYYNFGAKVARAKGWPKIDLLGSWGLAKEQYVPQDQTAADPDRKLQQQWYAGLKASMPFWGSTAEYTHTREQWTPVVSAYQGTEAMTNAYKFKILDKLDYYSETQLADIDIEKARQEFVKTKNDITLEVREACFNYEKALVQYEHAVYRIEYEKTDVEVKRAKRAMDEELDSELIESMIRLAQEEFGHVLAVADCHTSLAAVNKAIGKEDHFTDTGGA